MKQLRQAAIVTAAACALAIMSGCETPGDTALLGVLLGGMAPYAKTAQGAASMAAMGNAAGGYANAQAGRSQITVNNVQPSQPTGPAATISYNERKMNDGSVYTGTAELGSDGLYHPQGFGKIRYTNGNTYAGEFAQGFPEGRGTVEYADGNHYEGNLKRGKLDGAGKMTWADGRKYAGEFHDDTANGEGRVTLPDGTIFEGEWRDGKPVKGTCTGKDGDKYVGEYKDGKRHGAGKFTNKEGTIFDGQWESDKFRGGTTTRDKGEREEAQFDKDGRLVGKIVRTNTRGTRLETEVRNGKNYSSGIEVWPDGTKFDGVWDYAGKSGGTITWPNGKQYKGDWKIVIGEPDLPDGEGAMTWPDGRKYVGEFRDGKMHGFGKMTYSNGKAEEGLWKQDQFAGQQSAAGNATSRQQPSGGSGKQGTLTVASEANDCEVFVDGSFVGNTPAKLRLSEGAHSVEVKKVGYKTYKKDVTVSEGSELTLRPSLQKE